MRPVLMCSPVFRALSTYNNNGCVGAYHSDDDAADNGHRVAGSPERVWQEEYAGADRALEQVHKCGKVPAKISITKLLRLFYLFIDIV